MDFRSQEYELLPRNSQSSELDGSREHLTQRTSYTGLPWNSLWFGRRLRYLKRPRWWSNLDLEGNESQTRPLRKRTLWLPVFLRLVRLFTHFASPHGRYLSWLLWRLPLTIIGFVFLLCLFTATVLPSYTRLPEHYKVLKKACQESKVPGRGNILNEKVFIAATLYDPNGSIVGGQWGTAISELVQLLGPDNVYLSVYENDPDALALDALETLGTQLTCNKSLWTEHIPLKHLPHISLPSSESRIKRIAFLSEVRNRALRPLLVDPPTAFDKLLYLNDIVFDPIDAVQLLFSTGNAQYDAACAVDFINPFKFYDRYATRDLDGYEMGIPFYPWFTDAGLGVSRHNTLSQKDAVRVRACWGGMVAFNAMWFQKGEESSSDLVYNDSEGIEISRPLKFRYELDPYWDASECCLIHADLTYLLQQGASSNLSMDANIFMNPYVRVAYDGRTLSWLPYTRRVERLFPFIHNILDHTVGLPYENPRMWEQPGDKVLEKVWNVSEGAWTQVRKDVPPGRFCGRRSLSVLNEDRQEGEKKFLTLPPPE